MKLFVKSQIDTEDVNLTKQDKLELISELDGSQAEIDFTLDIIKMLVNSLIENDEMTKEELIKEIFEK